MAKISDLPLLDADWTYEGQLYLPVDLSTGVSRTTDQISAESLIEGYLANPTASETNVINTNTVYDCISTYLSEQFISFPEGSGVISYLNDFFSDYDSTYAYHGGVDTYLSYYLSSYLSQTVIPYVSTYLSENLPELIAPYLSGAVIADDNGAIPGETFLTLSYMNLYYDEEEYDPEHESYYQANNEFTTAWQFRMASYLSENSYSIYEAISQYL